MCIRDSSYSHRRFWGIPGPSAWTDSPTTTQASPLNASVRDMVTLLCIPDPLCRPICGRLFAGFHTRSAEGSISHSPLSVHSIRCYGIDTAPGSRIGARPAHGEDVLRASATHERHGPVPCSPKPGGFTAATNAAPPDSIIHSCLPILTSPSSAPSTLRIREICLLYQPRVSVPSRYGCEWAVRLR